MTRINIVPVRELTDQHLFAEFREIKMIAPSLIRSLNSKSTEQVIANIPKEFTLNKGHVYFFYNKGLYLEKRYKEISNELTLRNINYNKTAVLDPFNILCSSIFYNDYFPTEKDFIIVRERIQEK